MFDSIYSAIVTPLQFFTMAAATLVTGVIFAWIMSFAIRSTKRFFLVTSLIPLIVAAVITFVNGNIGAGVAVGGAFGLIRFRSAPGSAKEIGLVFLATAIGLATGMGYVVVAAVFFAIIALAMLLLTLTGFGAGAAEERELKITIPEGLDYDGLFDDLFRQYTRSAELEKVKTTNMGTLYELSYKIVLRDAGGTKSFLDALRSRNGNLTIVCGKPVTKEAL